MSRLPSIVRKLGILLLVLAAAGIAVGLWIRSRPAKHPDFEVTVSGQGRPVIFIPGIATPGTIWQPTVDALHGAYQCHVVTLAGFGSLKPTGSEPFLTRVRDEIIRYVRDQKLDHPVIVGHSMGGVMALWIAETAPQLPGRLVIVDALPDMAAIIYPGVSPREVRERIDERVARIQGSTPEEFAEFQRKLIAGWVTATDDIRRLSAMNSLSDPMTVGRALGEMMSADLYPDLRKIACPTLIMVSLADKLEFTPKEEVEKTFHQQYAPLRGTRIEWFEQSKHFIMVDDPVKFQQLLARELSAVGAK